MFNEERRSVMQEFIKTLVHPQTPPCEMVVGWRVDKDGERGEEIACGNTPTREVDGCSFCEECAMKHAEESR